MISPETHRGYNDENKCIVTKVAVDANTQINPEEVKAAIENVKAVFEEQLGNIVTALTGLNVDAQDAIIVQGTDMTKNIEEAASFIEQFAGSIADIDQIYEYAVEAHDLLQKSNNNDAFNLCIIDGVVRIE